MSQHVSLFASETSTKSPQRYSSLIHSRVESLGTSQYTDDTISAAEALSDFLYTAYYARLVPRSLNKLRGLSEASRIGEGADYRVEALRRDGHRPLVVKRVKALIPTMTLEGAVTVAAAPRIRKVLREILVTQHQPLKDVANIMKVEAYGWDYVGTDTVTPCLLSELAEHGNMRQYLKDASVYRSDERYLLWVGIARGLFALHSCDIVHGDVKLDNILITTDASTAQIVPKITDFGSSLFRHPINNDQQYLGTELYNAPEVPSLEACHVSKHSLLDPFKLCDVYAFGLLVWETFKNGASYISAHAVMAEKSLNTKDWRENALNELESSAYLSKSHVDKIRIALLSTLSPFPLERGTMHDILKSIGEDTIDGTKHEQIYVNDSQFRGMLDLGSYKVLSGIIHPSNFGSNTAATPMPWPVQRMLSSALKQICKDKNYVTAGVAMLNLSICYCVGIGVEQNTEQMLHWLRESARQGCREARIHYRRIHEAMGVACDDIVSMETESLATEEYLSTLAAASNKATYTTPFHELWNLKTPLFMFWTDLPDLQNDVLHAAVLDLPSEAIPFLVEFGYEDHQDQYGQTALLLACRLGLLDKVKRLLETGSDASVADNYGRTPLHMLIMFTHHEVNEAGELLLSSEKVDIDALTKGPAERCPDFWAELTGSPLEWAVISGNRTVAKFLIGHKADVESPIMAAVQLHLYDLVSLLFAAPDFMVELDFLQLCFSSLVHAHPFRRMLMHGKDFDNAMSSTIKVLKDQWNIHIATSDEIIQDKIRFRYSEDPSTKSQTQIASNNAQKTLDNSHIMLGINEIGLIPLLDIARHNLSFENTAIVRELLRLTHIRSGPNANDAIQTAITGCADAPFASNNQTALTLVEAGFPLDSSSNLYTGWSPLHLAAFTGNSIVVDAILRQQPRLVNLRNPEGETALHTAVRGTSPLAVIDLLVAKTDPMLLSDRFTTPLGTFISAGFLYNAHAVLPILLKACSQNHYTCMFSGGLWMNALHYATALASNYQNRRSQATEMLKAVLQQKCLKPLINLPGGDGYTALSSACSHLHLTSVVMLLGAGADPSVTTPSGLNCLQIILARTMSGSEWRKLDGPYAERLPDSYEMCLLLARATEKTPHDEGYTPLHLAVLTGYVEETLRIISNDPSQVFVLDGSGLTPRQRLLNNVIADKSDEIHDLHFEFISRAARLDEHLRQVEFQVSKQNSSKKRSTKLKAMSNIS